MKTIYIEKNDIHCTLTTYIYCNFSMLYAAEQLGYQPYINWPRGKFLQSYDDAQMFAKIPNAYEWYFEQPDKRPMPFPALLDIWTWEIAGEWSPYNLMAQPLSVIKEFYKKHLHFNATTNARGQAIVDKYKIDFSKTIGITWRGTDIYLDGRPYIPIETYFPFIDEILKDNPDFRIMCTAEEEGILEPLLKRYPQAFVIEEFISAPRGGKDNPERFSPVSGYERGLQPALMVWLFSKCAHYIKNRSSTGAVASWLSNGRIVCLGHEETLSYNLDYNYVEIEGKKYPLNL